MAFFGWCEHFGSPSSLSDEMGSGLLLVGMNTFGSPSLSSDKITTGLDISSADMGQIETDFKPQLACIFAT